MRALRCSVSTILVGLMLAVPAGARGDGGAFISFDQTHYLPGEIVDGESYVYVPRKHQDLIERGPFYAFLVNASGDADLRLGTVGIERSGAEEFELRMSFTVPDVAGDYYTVRICNDPCTVSGFREPLTGTISIVRTQREAALLNENTDLTYRTYALERKVRRAERTVEDLEAALAAAEAEVTAAAQMTTEVVAPSPPPAPIRSQPQAVDAGRPLVDAWALFGLGGALLVALGCVGVAIAFSRRPSVNDAMPVK